MTSQPLDFETDAVAKLLTDALRAGPGSPQWHDATQRLSSDDSALANEYRELLEARQRLESGRSYRAVLAGPGFTRSLMDQIEREPAGGKLSRLIPPAGAIAIISALLVIAAIAGLAHYLIPRTPPDMALRSTPGVERLASAYMVDTISAVSFDSGEIPRGWQPFGTLRMTFARGMRPAAPAAAGSGITPTTHPAIGGIVWGQPLDPEPPFAVEVLLRAGRPSDDLIPEIVIAEKEPVADHDGAAGSRELVWLLRDGRSTIVLPGGDVDAQPQRLRELSQPLTVRLTIDRANAIVEVNGKRVWAGEHRLSPDLPRYAACRFLKRDADRVEPISFQSVRIQRAAPETKPDAR